MRIGIDLGGSNLRGAAFDAGDVAAPAQWAQREMVGTDRRPEAIIERVAAMVDRLAADGTGPIDVGVGIAAMLRDRRGTVAVSPHLGWRDVAFGELLAARLGSRFRLGVYNDVNAITWGEHVAGAARGCRDVLAVYVGTGIGGGIIANGQLLEGSTNCAGEIGHVKVRWDDDAAPCACGGRGCVEAYVGGSYLEKRIAREITGGKRNGGARARLARENNAAVQLAGSIERVTPSHVDQAATTGDEWALGLWTDVATLLAIALGNALAILDSERLVLGGGLLSRTPMLFELVETALLVVTPHPILERFDVVAAELGDNAGLVGAAALAADGVARIE
ncbi:MAG: ROK family protein [Deltaproteobacteria bacterium]|nr:ROK family protein [Deltaproteobacteria bacterium]